MKTNNSVFNLIFRSLLFLFFLTSAIQPSFAKKTPDIPDPLKPWVEWVLHNQEEQFQCIPHYNDPETFLCSWPTELKINLNNEGGEFRQSWQIQLESWISLPGNNKQWPKEVKVDESPTVVVSRDNLPGIKLQPGTHTVTGSFAWHQMPEYLQIPYESALVSLTVNNNEIDFPNIDESGRLWLKSVQKEEKIEDRVKVEVFRLIDDKIPPQIVVYGILDVAGSAREITLGPIYSPENTIPVSLTSSLPAKMEQDARMRLQARPGRNNFTLTLRHVGQLQTLSFDHPNDGFWPRQEIWSFQTRSNLRIVEIAGVPLIDPLQTSMPHNWQKYPAYRLLPGEILELKEIKRGDPKPAPDQLAMRRNLWLRFDGKGYTIQDTIRGRKNTNWRLEMDSSIKLGRVAVDGTERFITQREGSKKAGVELREGILNLTADSIYQENISTLPAIGWDHDFHQVQGRLHLPPGWKLINASGIDNIPRTWLKRWTLLDFFIVLIFTIAAAKLFSKRLAGIAFITLVLIYHEPNAPRYIWLALLIGFALLKYLPHGKFKQAIKIYQIVILLVLIVITIPYSIHALRVGIYPQLAKPWASMATFSARQQKHSMPGTMDTDELALMEQEVTKQTAGRTRGASQEAVTSLKSKISKVRSPYYKSQVMQYDPKTITQTGPGLPGWQPFETINFSWSGPVTRDQTISFTLIGPITNLVLSFLRVFLIILLALGMFGIGYRRKQGFHVPGFKLFLIIPFLVISLFSSGICKADEIPSQEILNELQRRLLEKDDCFPVCADISDINITISPEKLIILVNVDTQVDTAIPLPGQVKHWLPQQVKIDNEDAGGLFRSDDTLWALVPSGIHTIELNGKIRKQNTLQLPFPLKPHRVVIMTSGWEVEGVHPDGTVDSQLQFKRIVNQEDKQTEILETGVLPSFALVERNILLGLVWKVETTIRRISPAGSAMVLNVPLLPGESVTTEGVHVENGIVHINMNTRESYLKWESFLEPSESIILKHAKTDDWTEIWKADVSPIFHMESDGIPIILHKTGNRWYPTWHPWPGEEVTLRIFRPSGIEGQTITIEKSHLELRPGQRTTNAKLSLTIKSSQGGQHTISLPLKAKLQEVKIGGKIQPIRQEGVNILLPITPGKQNIELQWSEPEGITCQYKTPVIDIGNQSVNASIDVYLPRNRWVLFLGGEQLVGPAILFWSVLIVIVLAAFGLAKTGLTPLRFHHWFLLGIGMSMSNLTACLVVVGWLMALDFRRRFTNLSKRVFNSMQIGIGVLTFFAMVALVFAISKGLLGHPDMSIVGNGSNSSLLRWYQDVSDNTLPQAWIFSIPMLAYRIAMLAWALWISFGLITILKWGWKQFTQPTIWYSSPAKPKHKPKIK